MHPRLTEGDDCPCHRKASDERVLYLGIVLKILIEQLSQNHTTYCPGSGLSSLLITPDRGGWIAAPRRTFPRKFDFQVKNPQFLQWLTIHLAENYAKSLKWLYCNYYMVYIAPSIFDCPTSPYSTQKLLVLISHVPIKDCPMRDLSVQFALTNFWSSHWFCVKDGRLVSRVSGFLLRA